MFIQGMDGRRINRDLSQTANRTRRPRPLPASVHIGRETRTMLPLCPLQKQTASYQKAANLETTTNIDHTFETIQLRQQQMGEIPKGRQFPIRKFRSNALFGIGATRNNITSQRIARTQ